MAKRTYTSKAAWFRRKAQQSDLALAGLIGIALIIVQDFLVLEPLTTPALVSLLAFAAAVPLLTAQVLINQLQTNFANVVSPWYMTLAASLGLLASYVGTVAAFWHASWVAGVVFAAASLLGLAVYLGFWADLNRANPGSPDSPDSSDSP